MRGRGHATALTALSALLGSAGCVGVRSYLDRQLPPPAHTTSNVPPKPPVAKASEVVPASAEAAEPAPPAPATVDEFVRLAVGINPRIARAAIAVDAAQGRYVQAGLYPNPELAIAWDEIGDRAGNGILTAPRITQSIVTGRKLSLAQAVAAREIDQATLDMLGERYAVVGSVRAAFYEALVAQQRAAILAELVKLTGESVTQGEALLEAKRIARLDLIQLQVERERFRADERATLKELPGLYRRLAAVAGDSALPVVTLTGSFDALPAYDLEQVRGAVLATHPEARSARVGVDRAQAAVRRAEAEPIPNITLYGAYIRQWENRSRDAGAGVSMPVPVWNRNQGNIRAARADLGMAIQNVGRVENDLAARVATAFQTYAAARERADRYRVEIVPRAEEASRLALEAFKGGQFDYLRVLQAQRAVGEARLELNRALGEAWRAAAELSGLMLEEIWPGPAAEATPKPRPEPKLRLEDDAPKPEPKKE